MAIRFGPSGNSQRFYDEGHKSSVEMPDWLGKMGLSAYEYQCNKGVKINRTLAEKLSAEAKKNDILLSIHAPYYINLAAVETEKRENSINYIMQTLSAAGWMDAKRVIFHPGSCTGRERKEAAAVMMDTFKETIKEADRNGFGNIALCPESMGKINQLGSLEEIIDLCKIDERVIPTIDFGHVHARGQGCLNSIEDFERILAKIENELGYERLKNLHVHFSRIEYTTGGEKKHWTLDDVDYGPEFKYLAELIVKKRMEPVIICESREKMDDDALKLKQIYLETAEKMK